MKRIILSFLAITACTAAFSQRPVELTIMNNKGKELKHKDIVVYIKGEHPEVHTLNSSGQMTLDKIYDRDTLDIIIHREMYEFPMNGVKDLTLKVNRQGRIVEAMRNGHPMLSTGYNMVPKSANPYNVQVTEGQNPGNYLSLADYLTGRIAGLVIDGGPGNYQAYLNGSIPLVVLDGLRMQSFNAANNLVNTSDIESVTVDYNGALYGASGLNGVLIITLKS